MLSSLYTHRPCFIRNCDDPVTSVLSFSGCNSLIYKLLQNGCHAFEFRNISYLILLFARFLILNNYWWFSFVLWFFFQVNLNVEAVFLRWCQIQIIVTICYSYKVYPFPISTSATILSSVIVWTLNFRLPHEMIWKLIKSADVCPTLISQLKPIVGVIIEKCKKIFENCQRHCRTLHSSL